MHYGDQTACSNCTGKALIFEVFESVKDTLKGVLNLFTGLE
jgi:hypothetical protein